MARERALCFSVNYRSEDWVHEHEAKNLDTHNRIIAGPDRDDGIGSGTTIVDVTFPTKS